MDTNRPWGVHTIHDVIGHESCTAEDASGVYRAVPEPYHGSLRERLTCAWWVITGRAYALRWPTLGEFEAAAGVRFRKSP